MLVDPSRSSTWPNTPPPSIFHLAQTHPNLPPGPCSETHMSTNTKFVLRHCNAECLCWLQGAEKEVIILATTTTNPHSEFCSDGARLNVALTRARRHLVVVGAAAVLAQVSQLGQVTQLEQRLRLLVTRVLHALCRNPLRQALAEQQCARHQINACITSGQLLMCSVCDAVVWCCAADTQWCVQGACVHDQGWTAERCGLHAGRQPAAAAGAAGLRPRHSSTAFKQAPGNCLCAVVSYICRELPSR